MLKKLITPWIKCTSITNGVLNLFDRFTASYICMRRNIRKLITPRVQCRSIRYRVFRLFDRFTAYNNCMSWSIRKLITPRVLCTHILKRILGLFDRFKAFLPFYELKCHKSHNCASSVHNYNKSSSKTIWPFYAYYNCMSWGIRKLIALRVRWKGITYRVLS